MTGEQRDAVDLAARDTWMMPATLAAVLIGSPR
jgi:hypothetical protein